MINREKLEPFDEPALWMINYESVVVRQKLHAPNMYSSLPAPEVRFCYFNDHSGVVEFPRQSAGTAWVTAVEEVKGLRRWEFV